MALRVFSQSYMPFHYGAVLHRFPRIYWVSGQNSRPKEINWGPINPHTLFQARREKCADLGNICKGSHKIKPQKVYIALFQ